MDTLILFRLWGDMIDGIVCLFGIKQLRVVTLSILIPVVFYGFFTNAAGQEAPTSVSRGRNARFSGVFSLCNIALRQNI
jgi:hypothetical protein